MVITSASLIFTRQNQNFRDDIISNLSKCFKSQCIFLKSLSFQKLFQKILIMKIQIFLGLGVVAETVILLGIFR